MSYGQKIKDHFEFTGAIMPESCLAAEFIGIGEDADDELIKLRADLAAKEEERLADHATAEEIIAAREKTIRHLHKRTNAAESLLSLAVEGLEAVEWVQVPSLIRYREVDYVCVWHCGGTRETGHKDGCKRQTILAKLTPGNKVE